MMETFFLCILIGIIILTCLMLIFLFMGTSIGTFHEGDSDSDPDWFRGRTPGYVCGHCDFVWDSGFYQFCNSGKIPGTEGRQKKWKLEKF